MLFRRYSNLRYKRFLGFPLWCSFSPVRWNTPDYPKPPPNRSTLTKREREKKKKKQAYQQIFISLLYLIFSFVIFMLFFFSRYQKQFCFVFKLIFHYSRHSFTFITLKTIILLKNSVCVDFHWSITSSAANLNKLKFDGKKGRWKFKGSLGLFHKMK